MSDSIELLKTLVPEMITLLEKRYTILKSVGYNQPVGRRLLAEQVKLGERVVRSEVEFLKNMHLLAVDSAGVSLTPECDILMSQLAGLIHGFRGLTSLETYLKEKMNLERVIIVPGNVDEQISIMHEIGKVAGKYVSEIVDDNWVVAVTGGTSMAEVARQIPATQGKKGILVVPARGGMGEVVEIQSNTIAAGIATKLGGIYKLLHVPDYIPEEALENFLLDHRTLETITLAKEANLLLHGIGIPRVMAARRDMEWQSILKRASKLPVGEAFGYYFAEDGSVAVNTHTVGPRLEDVKQMKRVVAVAAGKSKAVAILSVLRAGFIKALVTDQGAAEALKEILN